MTPYSGEKVPGAVASDKDALVGLEGSEVCLIAAWHRDIVMTKGDDGWESLDCKLKWGILVD